MRSAGSIVDEQGKLNNFAIEPRVYVQENPRSGFTPYAEILNGRLAMVGFISLLALEAVSGHGLIGFLTSL
ncbi:CAB/ELIP/HLIP superfamily [uncultured Coleofasciculus sp.]|uniref:CAB/ELIP/HLIP superfamily n=1 Tax=uncultured Coleofasciculus sp. TaxID=1267456 RepID=A0A6J4IM86_9CYAN|nr:CAB/ELIP/HLIP superfamily [uncultured Coleofasciculus sp.]